MSAENLPPWISYLAEAGRLAPSADNSQPWRFGFDGRTLTLEFDEARGGSLGKDHPAVLLALGAVIENLVQAAQGAGMDSSRWGFPAFAETGCLVRIPAPTQNLEAREIPQAIRARHTNRGPFARTPLADEIASRITQLREGCTHALVFNERGAISSLAQLVRLASELRFQTEEIHRWLAGSLRFTLEEVAAGDGLDVDTLSLPPGGRALSRYLADWRRMAFLNRFGAYKLLARVEAAQFTQAGAIVAIVGQDLGSRSWLDAGKLLERVWLYLTEQGVAVHPYFVLPDQLERLKTGRIPPNLHPAAERLAQEAEALFNGTTPFMLLRVGRARKPAKRSRRLPLAVVLVSTQA